MFLYLYFRGINNKKGGDIMVSLRPILKICLSAILIGSAVYKISRCSNDYMYQSTGYEMKYSKPKCDDIEQRIKHIKDAKMPSIIKYIIGEYGKLGAMEDYRESYCR